MRRDGSRRSTQPRVLLSHVADHTSGDGHDENESPEAQTSKTILAPKPQRKDRYEGGVVYAR